MCRIQKGREISNNLKTTITFRTFTSASPYALVSNVTARSRERRARDCASYDRGALRAFRLHESDAALALAIGVR